MFLYISSAATCEKSDEHNTMTKSKDKKDFSSPNVDITGEYPCSFISHAHEEVNGKFGSSRGSKKYRNLKSTAIHLEMMIFHRIDAPDISESQDIMKRKG